MATIEGKSLNCFHLSPDGNSFRITVNDAAGRQASLTLPTDCLCQILMTVPRIVEESLRVKHSDTSLRFVHPLGGWKLETAFGDPRYILTLRTPDGFNVAFAVSGDDIQGMNAVVADEQAVGESLRRAIN